MTPDTYWFRLTSACYDDCLPGDVLEVMPPMDVFLRVRDGALLPAHYGRLAGGLASGEIVAVRPGEAAPALTFTH